MATVGKFGGVAGMEDGAASGSFPGAFSSVPVVACASAVAGAGLTTKDFNRTNTPATQRNKSCMVISSVIVNAIRSQAARAITAPHSPRPKNSKRSKRLPIYPPPAPSFAATSAVASLSWLRASGTPKSSARDQVSGGIRQATKSEAH